MTLLISGLFWLSRVTFLNWGNVMFDSNEYLMRWANPNFLEALLSGHIPLHSGYVFSFWPIFQLFKLINLDPALGVLLAQTGLAYLTVYYFYKIVCLLRNKEVAMRAAILLSLLPIFWLVNEVVMMETTYLCYWTISFYYLIRFSHNQGSDIKNLGGSVIFWIMSFLTHTVIILWIPLFVYEVWRQRPKTLKYFLMAGLIAIGLASSINAALLSYAHQTSFFDGWYLLYGAKFNEHAQGGLSILGILRYGRNWLTPLLYNNTWMLLILSLVFLFKTALKNLKLGIFYALWLLPSLITNQWWDSLLFGRHALISSLIIVLLVVERIKDGWFKVLAILVFLISLSSLCFLKSPTPYIRLAEVVRTLPGDGLYIESHFARPQIDGVYKGKIIFVDEPGWNLEMLPKVITGYLNENKPVMISVQALSEPYGLFCGPVLHNLSLSYKNRKILTGLEKQFKMEKMISLDPKLNLEIYQITKGSGEYPQITDLRNSSRRLDYYDPIRNLINLFLKRVLGSNPNL